ncbi:hypothetical protein [Nostoc sp.]
MRKSCPCPVCRCGQYLLECDRAGAVTRKCFAPLHWAYLEGVFAQAPALLKGSMKLFQPYIRSKPLVEGINSILPNWKGDRILVLEVRSPKIITSYISSVKATIKNLTVKQMCN